MTASTKTAAKPKSRTNTSAADVKSVAVDGQNKPVTTKPTDGRPGLAGKVIQKSAVERRRYASRRHPRRTDTAGRTYPERRQVHDQIGQRS